MNKLRAVISTVAIAVVTTVTVQADNTADKQISFNNNGMVLSYETNAETLGEFLNTADQEVVDSYIINADLNTKLEDENLFEIDEKINVQVKVGSDVIRLKYPKGITVAEIILDLETQNPGVAYYYETGELDKVIDSDYLLHFSTGDVEVVNKVIPLEYTTTTIETDELYVGETKVQTEGVDGLQEVDVTKTYYRGELVERQENVLNVIQEPVTEVILVGTKAKPAPVQSAVVGEEELNYSKKLTMSASAYTNDYASTGKRPGDVGFGVTASGRTAKRGVVAVDPKVIPLGTKLYIPGYGYAVAGDTGGAIKGNKIDLFMDTTKECLNFGRRNVTVYVLN